MNHLNSGHVSAGLDIYSVGFRVVVVVVKAGETEEQAWHRHLKKNPKDRIPDIKIFHFDSQ